MRSTVLYRPHTAEETIGLIAETLDAMLDGRTDDFVYGKLRAWGEMPEGEHDASTLRTALRYLLPTKGVADSRFRIDHGWTTDEITQIIALLRTQAESLRGAAAFALKMKSNPQGVLKSNPQGVSMLSGTAETLMRDADKMKQVFINLLQNGLGYVSEGGHIWVSSVRQDRTVEIRFANDGPPIPPEVLDRLFVPFATTRPEGTGLGLVVVHQIVTEHGGHIAVDSSAPNMTVFRIRLPLRR